MKIIEKEPVVIIDVPRFCVSKEDADEFIKIYCNFWENVQSEMIDINGSNRFIFDNRYVKGDFIPTVRQVSSYTNVLSPSIRVEQVDKYVLLDENEHTPYSEELEQIWYPESNEKEDNDETI